MAAPSQRFFDHMYQRAGRRPQALPWHRDRPPALLERVVAERGTPGRALDIGCGSGVFSVYLARQGYRVTAIDFSASAIAMARRTVADAGADVQLIQGDVLEWPGTERFDLIFDSGCMHGFSDQARVRYRDRLMSWLAEGGDYVLGHFDKRHALDWRPIGPRRLPAPKVLSLFVPPLVERAREYETHRVPLPVGPVVRVGVYWMRNERDFRIQEAGFRALNPAS